MTVTINNNYPIFEADQVLTADHLNDAFEYLEEQQRLTRVKLIGMGIVCGLDAWLASGGSAVAVSTGVGITSKGYLVTFKGNAPDGVTNYPFFTTYSDPNEDIYPFFLKGGAQIPLYELREQKIQGAEPLSELPNPLTDYAVLMYLECFDKKLKNCVENDCNEKGTERIFTLRILLVAKEDMRNIICMEEALNGPKSEEQLEEIVNARFQLDGLQLPRINLSTNLVSATQLIIQYQQLITTSLPAVQKALLDSYKYFNPVLNSVYQGRGGFADTVINDLPRIYQQFAVSNLCRLQYFYDLLCDLTETYNEFIEAAFDLWTACCPSMAPFPKHLRLNGLTLTGRCEPSIYRTRFLNSPIHNDQGVLLERVRALHLKMYLLIQQFSWGANLPDIRITPSREVDTPLPGRAIPAYYNINDELLKNWNPELKRKCRYNENLSYHAAQYAVGPRLDHVRNPLNYALKNYDFFRIEGHLCRTYRFALAEINRLRHAHNLPFDIVALKLSNDPSGTDVEDIECIFQDLETICEAWKEEMACLLSKTMRGVTNYNPVDVYRPEAEIATDLNYTTRFDRQISIVDSVIDSINQQEGYLGNYVIQVLDTDTQDPCGNRDDAVKIIEQDIKLADFTPTQMEYQIAVYYPTTIATHLVNYARVIDTKCSDLDIARLEEAQSKLLKPIYSYYNTLNAYTTGDRTFRFDTMTMLQLMTQLINTCSLERIKVIKAEIDRRKEKLRRMNLFSEYLGKNPGMDHQAGVPKGGTFILVYSGEQFAANNIIPAGTVIADFFLPYLCCSDCPPIAYILPPPEAEVGLSIKQDNYCVPYDFTIYPFEITPAGGEVTGDGVFLNENNQYAFDPNQVDLGEEIRRVLNFQVNRQAVPLVITVERKAAIKFTTEIFWDTDEAGAFMPFITLVNEAFDDRYTWQWDLFVIEPATGDARPLPGNPIAGDTEKVTVPLQGLKEGMVIRVVFTGTGETCSDSDSQEFDIPSPPAVVDLAVLNANFGPITTRRFANTDGNVYFFRGTPGEGELILENAVLDEFIRETTVKPEANDYQWTPEGKKPIVYNFLYKHANGEDRVEITIFDGQAPPVDTGLFLEQAALIDRNVALMARSTFFSNFLQGSPAYEITREMSKRIASEWRDPAAFEKYRSGANDDQFAEQMNAATEDMANRVLEGSRDRSAQNYLLDLYQAQIDMAITFAAMLEEDMSTRNSVSKLFTVVTNQIKKLKSSRVNVAPKLKFDKTLDRFSPALAGKDRTKKKIEELLTAVNE